MAEHRHEGPGENGSPIPRDLPDQQAHAGEDPWEVVPARERGDTDDVNEPGGSGEPGRSDDEQASEVPDTEVPDTDEAGTGRQGAPKSASVHPEHPVPDESSA
ncbi:hypothetical protein ACIO93_04580 [Streptomyces sp. NPDC087903]|uniref:hypothetical protein n=1 Tax=Streptomyces sp. NPDC087903 TaxID=3365819 RepID=UPI00382B843F